MVPTSGDVASSTGFYYGDDAAENYRHCLMLAESILAVALLVLSFAVGFKAGQWWTWATGGGHRAVAPTKAENHELKTSCECCQAPTRYNLDLATPRFQPLPDYARGAFVDVRT